MLKRQIDTHCVLYIYKLMLHVKLIVNFECNKEP